MHIPQTCRGYLHPEKETRHIYQLIIGTAYVLIQHYHHHLAITSNTSTFTNITVTTPDTIASYYLCMHAHRALHEKSDLRQIYLVQIRSKKVLTRVKSRAKIFVQNLQPHVNWCANAVFTIFAIDFLLVCTFSHHICTEQICVNLTFRAPVHSCTEPSTK